MDITDKLTETPRTSEAVYDGCLLHVRRDTVFLPDGRIAPREVIRHVGAACVVPVTADGRVIIEHQYRYPMAEVTTEIPAGKLDSKTEAPLDAAKRELQEETGLTAESWTSLGVFYPTPAYSDEKIYMYLAQNLHYGEQKLDEGEFLNVQTVTLMELLQDVMEGKITDGKTQTALLKTARILNV